MEAMLKRNNITLEVMMMRPTRWLLKRKEVESLQCLGALCTAHMYSGHDAPILCKTSLGRHDLFLVLVLFEILRCVVHVHVIS